MAPTVPSPAEMLVFEAIVTSFLEKVTPTTLAYPAIPPAYLPEADTVIFSAVLSEIVIEEPDTTPLATPTTPPAL